MASPPLPRRMFAHARPSPTGGTSWAHVYPSPVATRLCGSDPVHEVEVAEAPDGVVPSHWGWWDIARGSVSLIYPSEQLVRLCSPDFFQSAIARGEGRILRLLITRAPLPASTAAP